MARSGFDDWTKVLSTTRTRRAALGLSVAGLVAGGRPWPPRIRPEAAIVAANSASA